MKKVIIIGSGISGLSAAINLAKKGIGSYLISFGESQRSQSVMAEGGINACLNTMNENDTTSLHALETFKAGKEIASFEAIKLMCDEAPMLVSELKSLGLLFNLNNDGTIKQRQFGGQTKKRTCYSDSQTGKQIVSTLASYARFFEANMMISRITDKLFYKLNIDGGILNGVILYDKLNDTYELLEGSKVIIACGGMNGLFNNYSGSMLNDASVQASLFNSGVSFTNLEMIQYHPTTINIGPKNMLVTEAVRAEGARLCYLDGNTPVYFMEKFPLKDLMPRDIVSREIYSKMNEGHKVYLDARGLDPQVYKDRISAAASSIRKYTGLDLECDLIPVEPGIHYYMGGISVDINHKTSISGLYAIGEASSLYHGANRLGGNSLLGAIYSGYKVASSISIDDIKYQSNNSKSIQIENTLAEEFNLTKYLNEFKTIMSSSLGVIRDESSLNNAILRVNEMIEYVSDKLDSSASLYENTVFKNQLWLGYAFLSSALSRKASLGAHYRSDYSDEDKSYTSSFAKLDNKKIIISFKDVSGVSHDN